jgi:hypothetical protein
VIDYTTPHIVTRWLEEFMATAVRKARNELRSRAKKLDVALKKIQVWKKKAAAFDRLKKKKVGRGGGGR